MPKASSYGSGSQLERCKVLHTRCSWVLALPPEEHWQVNSFGLLLAVPPGFGMLGSDSGDWREVYLGL